MHAFVDRLHCADVDRVIAKAVGMVAGGAFLILYAAHRLTRGA